MGLDLRYTLWHRSPRQSGPKVRSSGRFSTKDMLFSMKKTPSFSSLTPQQKKVKEAGTVCKAAMSGITDYKLRTKVAADCIRNQFGKPMIYEDQTRQYVQKAK